MAFDQTKPANDTSMISQEIRDNFIALKNDGIVKAKTILNGLDSSKSISPGTGDIYVSTDTLKVYVCKSVGVWSLFSTSYSTTFIDASLVAGILSVSHNLNTQYINYIVLDNNNEQIIPDSATSTDANTLTLDLTSYDTISGTWKIKVFI